MARKKNFGWVVLLVALLFLEPSPDPVTFSAYCMTHDLQYSTINAGNIASHLWSFELWSWAIGGILLFIAMYLLGWDFKQLMRRLNLGKYKIALAIGVLVVGIIAWLDIQGLIFFTDLGRDYTSGDFPHSYWIAFRNTAYILMGLVALCYWNFVRKDKSETAAVFLTPFILFWTGLADILYFVFQGLSIPDNLPWLDSQFPIGWISNALGFPGVTNVSLLISVFIGLVTVFLLTKFMKEKI